VNLHSFADAARSIRWACLGLGHVHSLADSDILLRSWRYAEIEVCDGELLSIHARWWPRVASQWDAWRDSYMRTLPADVCRVYYAFPIRAPGFMTVSYAHSGPRTQYKTLFRGVQAVDEIAAIWNAQAIVCQATNERLNERLLNRLGYVRHALSLGNNHFIKRLGNRY